MKKRFRQFIGRHSRLLIYWALTLIAGSLALLYKLGSLTAGFSGGEVATLQHSLSARTLSHDPLNLPLTGLQWLSLHIGEHHYGFARLPSVVIGVGALVCLAYILQRWYGRRAAVLGLILITASSWFLHVSRSASPDILYFSAVPALLAAHLLLRDHPNNFLTRLLWLVLHAAYLFVPGLVWVVLLSVALQYKDAWRLVRHPGAWWQATVLLLVGLLAIGWLGFGLAREPHLIRIWLGLPESFEPWRLHVVRLVQSVSYFVVRGPHTPALWLGRLPILDAVATLMLITGLIFYGKHLRAPRTQLLIAFFVLGALLFGLNGPVSFSLLVPTVYIIATAGIAYLLHAWLKVFPRNPLARGLGIGVLCAAIALSCAYNLRSYFVAWPKNSEAAQAMQLKPPVRTPVGR